MMSDAEGDMMAVKPRDWVNLQIVKGRMKMVIWFQKGVE